MIASTSSTTIHAGIGISSVSSLNGEGLERVPRALGGATVDTSVVPVAFSRGAVVWLNAGCWGGGPAPCGARERVTRHAFEVSEHFLDGISDTLSVALPDAIGDGTPETVGVHVHASILNGNRQRLNLPHAARPDAHGIGRCDAPQGSLRISFTGAGHVRSLPAGGSSCSLMRMLMSISR